MKHKTAFCGTYIGLTALWLTLSSHAALAAGDFPVTVLEFGTGDPVAHATVAIVEAAQFGETDSRGKISLPAAQDEFTLKVLATGYQVVERKLVYSANGLTLYLEPLSFIAEEVVVTADRIEHKQSKISLDSETVRRAPGNQGDPLKTILSLPGVVSAYDGTGVAYIRGGEDYDNQVWANNAEIGYLYHFGGLTSSINAELVQDFNLISGGYPVRYGDGLGGVIDIKLRKPKTDRYHGSVELGNYVSGFLVEGPVNATAADDGFIFAARRSYIDLILSPADFAKLGGQDTDNQFLTVPRFYDMQAMWYSDMPNGHQELKFLTAGDELALLNNDAKKNDPEAAGKLKVKNAYDSLSYNWQQQWNPQWSSTLAVVRSVNYEDFQIGADPVTQEPYTVNTQFIQHRIQPELQWQIDQESRLNFGGSANYLEVPIDLYISAPPSERTPDYNLTEAQKYRVDSRIKAGAGALFGDYRRQLTERFAATAGLRYSHVRATGGVDTQDTMPRLATEYRLRDTTLLTASWGRYVQLPPGYEILTGFGNPGLTFRKAEHRIIGVQEELSPQWAAKVEIYHNPMTDLVVDVPNASPPNNYSNDGEGLAYGAELFLQRKPEGHKMGWVSYAYGRTERKDNLTGKTRLHSGDQPHTLTAVWGQPMTGDWSHWTWGVKVQYHSGKLYTPVTGRTFVSTNGGYWSPDMGAQNSKRFPDYFKADLRFDRYVRYNTWKMNYYFDLQNVTFQQNVQGYDYGKEYENYNNPKKQTGLPFMPFVGVEAQF